VCTLREMLNIPGRSREVITSFLDKGKCKKILQKGGVRQHKFFCPDLNDCTKDIDAVIKRAEDMMDYPMYTKPTQYMSSLGHFKINNQDDLRKAIKSYVDTNFVFEIDEFLTGTLVGMDCIIINNEIKFFVAWVNACDYVKQYEGQTTGQIMLLPDDLLYKRLFKYLE
jgi:D-alanine-D-alanine ligase-like ATP-grasp enzyme